jgi:hypothetical protein
MDAAWKYLAYHKYQAVFPACTNRVADFLIPVNLLGDSMENPYLRANDT